MLQKKRLGVHIFTRGMKGGIKSINTPIYAVSLYELLKTYSNIQMHKTFQNINIPKLPVFTTGEGVQHLKNQIDKVYKNHKYFYSKRDINNDGLVYIYHNWESGTDNSPVWDDIWKTMNPPIYKFERKPQSNEVTPW